MKSLQAATLGCNKTWFKVGQGSLGRVLHCSFPPRDVDVCDVEMGSHNIYPRNNDVWFGSLLGVFPSTRQNLHPKSDGADLIYSCSWPLINPRSEFIMTHVGLTRWKLTNKINKKKRLDSDVQTTAPASMHDFLRVTHKLTQHRSSLSLAVASTTIGWIRLYWSQIGKLHLHLAQCCWFVATKLSLDLQIRSQLCKRLGASKDSHVLISKGGLGRRRESPVNW